MSILDQISSNLIVAKKFPQHLMEKSGLLRYAAESGQTVLTISYDAGTKDGWLLAVASDPEPTVKAAADVPPEQPKKVCCKDCVLLDTSTRYICLRDDRPTTPNSFCDHATRKESK